MCYDYKYNNNNIIPFPLGEVKLHASNTAIMSYDKFCLMSNDNSFKFKSL